MWIVVICICSVYKGYRTLCCCCSHQLSKINELRLNCEQNITPFDMDGFEGENLSQYLQPDQLFFPFPDIKCVQERPSIMTLKEAWYILSVYLFIFLLR